MYSTKPINRLSQLPISKDAFFEITLKEPRRICFSSTHRNALIRQPNDSKGFIGKFSVPFCECIKALFDEETGLNLFPNTQFGNCWHSIKEEVDYSTINAFVEKYKENVFIRDTLSISVALSENLDENEAFTHLGDLERRAKYDASENAIAELFRYTLAFINESPFYKDCDIICPVPSMTKKSLPEIIATQISQNTTLTLLSEEIYWTQEKPKIKNEEINDKWSKLESSGLTITVDVKGKNIILLDDMYQSGVTLNYVGYKLREAGAKNILGLSIVKARNNK